MGYVHMDSSFTWHKYKNGNMESGFYDKDKDATIYYSTGTSKGKNSQKK